MKKIFVAASLVFAAVAVKAQDFKPTAGKVTAEVGVTGLSNLGTNLNTSGTNTNYASGTSSYTSPNSQLKFRYFLADQLAVRIGANFGTSSMKETKTDSDPTNPQTGTIKASYSKIMFNLGVEKHFEGSERLSPYVGADLLLSFTNVKETGTDVNYVSGGYSKGDNYTIKGATNHSAIFGAPSTSPYTPQVGSGIGLRAVVGADFYFVPKVYLGTEFGLGFLASSQKKVQTSGVMGGTQMQVADTEGAKTFNFGPAMVAGLRLGFVF